MGVHKSSVNSIPTTRRLLVASKNKYILFDVTRRPMGVEDTSCLHFASQQPIDI